MAGENILVADDELVVRSLLGVALRQHGFAVLLAGGGREALDLFRRHGGGIAVVLLDVRMPGMDGPQALAALRELDPSIPVVFMSGDTGSYDVEDLEAMGAAAVIAKPFGSLEGLARTLRQAARAREAVGSPST
jgi:CheY-like chemotaxis protein